MRAFYMDGVKSMCRVLQRAGIVGFTSGRPIGGDLMVVLNCDETPKVSEALNLYRRFLAAYPPNMRAMIHSEIVIGITQAPRLQSFP